MYINPEKLSYNALLEEHKKITGKINNLYAEAEDVQHLRLQTTVIMEGREPFSLEYAYKLDDVMKKEVKNYLLKYINESLKEAKEHLELVLKELEKRRVEIVKYN